MGGTEGREEDQNLAALVRGFRGRRCVVIGDLMLDVFERGRADRLAPDVPAPVVTNVREESSPGGAANVAVNLAALGAEVTLLGVIGDDASGADLLKKLGEAGIQTGEVLRVPGRATVVKRRLVADGATLARVDSGDTTPLEGDAQEDFAQRAAFLAADAGVVVVSDYSGGVVTGRVAEALAGHGCVVLDSKDLLRLRWRGLAAATPNHLEAQSALGLPVEADPGRVDAGAVGESLRREIGAGALAVTLAEEGVAVADDAGVARIGGHRVANPDVNGAGDTFLAAFALALGDGVPPRVAARLGVEAATLAVARPGTAPVGARELLQRLPEEDAGGSMESLEKSLVRVRHLGGKVVFTNGCFDLLHRGHLFLLREARKLGDLLVVGVNSDASACRVKGPGRPVTPEEDRIELLEALPCVDHVIVFDGDTPEALIRQVKPDLHVKGGDHAGERLVEECVVKEFGGEVVVLPLLPGRSASATIKHIRSVGSPVGADVDGVASPAAGVQT